jgi:hypothetical protein
MKLIALKPSRSVFASEYEAILRGLRSNPQMFAERLMRWVYPPKLAF